MAIVSLWTGCLLAETANSELKISRVDVGFSGILTVGKWTPLTVEASSTEPFRIIVETIDSDGLKVRFPSDWITPSATKDQTQTVFFQAGRLDAFIRLILENKSGGSTEKLIHDAGNRNSPIIILKQSTSLILTLGHPAGFENRPADSPKKTSGGVRNFLPDHFRVLELESVKALPTNPLSYNAIQTIVLADGFDVSREQSEALKRWVGNGGHLVLCAGSHIDQFLPNAQNASRLTDWLPGKFLKTELFSDLHSMEAYSGRTARIRIDEDLRVGILEDPASLERAMGEVLANSPVGPIMIRSSFGFGKVTSLGLDFHQGPIKTWPSKALVAGKILGINFEKDSSFSFRTNGKLTHSGMTDLKSQLVGALDYFPESRRFSAWFAMGLLVLYTILLGPIDYLIVHRVLKKPQWTWLTFPILVLSACSLTTWMAFSTKNTEIQLNKFELVDIDATQMVSDDRSVTPARIHSWFVLVSPETQRLNLQIEKIKVFEKTHSPAQEGNANKGRLASSGIPETSFGGIYRPGGLELGLPSYHFSSRSAGIPDLPILKWSTKSLSASWFDDNLSLVTSDLVSTSQGQLKGLFRHQFPVPIEDWMIVFHKRVFLPDPVNNPDSLGITISPNSLWELDTMKMRTRDIQGFLTRTTTKTVESTGSLKLNETIQEKKPYDTLSRDFLQFVRILSFHKYAGGKGYTGLENNSLRHLEFLDAMKMNQAILIGRLKTPLTRLKVVNGDKTEIIEETKQDTFVRILLPVKIIKPKVEIKESGL